MNRQVGRMVLCHMLADTTEELLQMADKLGVKRKWIQKPNTRQEHLDVCLSNKKKALALGAKEINRRELDLLLEKKKQQTLL